MEDDTYSVYTQLNGLVNEPCWWLGDSWEALAFDVIGSDDAGYF